MKVSVFGGASPKTGEPAYQEAMLLGQLLAQAGHTVMTGGYIGTMEAVSRGAAEAGGHVIGVTCDEIEQWRGGVCINAWVKEEWRNATLQDRLNALITRCDAAFALPGGIGTLAEIATMWNLMVISARPIVPLIMIGNGWHRIINDLMDAMKIYIPENDHHLVAFAPDVLNAFNLFKKLTVDIKS